jgi:serine/threonine protein kinase
MREDRRSMATACRGKKKPEKIIAGCAESRLIATDNGARDSELRPDREDVVSSRGPPLPGQNPATSQTSSGHQAMNPDPLDLESTARAPGDPTAYPPPLDAGLTADLPAPRRITEGPGTWIGPYKLLQQLGEGGMGVVYMAEQDKPIRRRVALKVIKAGMDTDQVVARFEAERQALAMMEHPNVARVFDGGTTDAGRPFFAMELVRGVALTKYCDDNHLTPKNASSCSSPSARRSSMRIRRGSSIGISSR